MFFRRLKASQSTLNLCSEAELSIVCYTYGIDARLRRYFASRLLAVLWRSDCHYFYLRIVSFYIFVHTKKSRIDTVKKTQKSR